MKISCKFEPQGVLDIVTRRMFSSSHLVFSSSYLIRDRVSAIFKLSHAFRPMFSVLKILRALSDFWKSHKFQAKIRLDARDRLTCSMFFTNHTLFLISFLSKLPPTNNKWILHQLLEKIFASNRFRCNYIHVCMFSSCHLVFLLILPNTRAC